jgi:hypothetical protein
MQIYKKNPSRTSMLLGTTLLVLCTTANVFAAAVPELQKSAWALHDGGRILRIFAHMDTHQEIIGIPYESFCMATNPETSAKVKNESGSTFIDRDYISSRRIIIEQDKVFVGSFRLTCQIVEPKRCTQ